MESKVPQISKNLQWGAINIIAYNTCYTQLYRKGGVASMTSDKLTKKKINARNDFSESSKNFTASKLLAAKSDKNDCQKWLPLWMHLLDTAEVMDYLVLDWLPDNTKFFLSDNEEILSNTARSLGAMHDIGKATPLFQSKISKNIQDLGNKLKIAGIPVSSYNYDSYTNSPHALAGEAILINRDVSKDFAAIVGSHHGIPHPFDQENWAQLQISPYSATYSNYYDNFHLHLKDIWINTRSELINDVLNLCDCTLPNESVSYTTQQQMIWSGLLIMADWIASNETYFPLLSVKDEAAVYPDRVEKALKKLDLPSAWEPSYYSLSPQQFKSQFGFASNVIQKCIGQEAASVYEPGLFILEAPMGSGKTEAALSAAEVLASRTGCGGLFLGMPTQATSNGIFPRIENWAASQAETDQVTYSIKLAHGAAELNEDYQAIFRGTSTTNEDSETDADLLVHPWFEGRKQALLSNFVIGTVDQILMMALKQRHLMLRHLGLAGKIVIIDECHAYDAYMDQYLEQALAWLGAYEVPVILLSATLPCETRTQLIRAYQNKRYKEFKQIEKEPWMTNRAYPLLTYTDGKTVISKEIPSDISNHTVRINRIDDDAVCDSLSVALSEGGCAGVILNTVKRAQFMAKKLQAAFPDYEIIIFHSGFTMEQRAAIEKILLSRLGKKSQAKNRNHLIVVGTQVLEQSLDIDFDVMVTDLCPVDLLFQRLGRLHRHPRNRPIPVQDAVCYVLGAGENQELEKGSVAVYGEYLLQRTKEILPDQFSIPKDISETVQNVYDQTYLINPQKEADALQDYQNHLNMLRQSANAYRLSAPLKSGSFHGLLSTAVPNDVKADAAVRYGTNSIDVILLKHDAETDLLSTLSASPKRFDPNKALSDEEALAVARQRLRLPSVFSSSWCIDETISFLEEQSKQWVPLWLTHPILKGELFLILDENNRAQLNAYTIGYDLRLGFYFERKTAIPPTI